MKDGNVNKNLVLPVCGSIIILYGADGGDAVRIGTAMLQTQLGARHILLGGPIGHASWMRVEVPQIISHGIGNKHDNGTVKNPSDPCNIK